jgi:hypothetical protein
MDQDQKSVIQNFRKVDIERSLKIFTLISILIKYFYSYADSNGERKPEYSVALSAYFYLLELI